MVTQVRDFIYMDIEKLRSIYAQKENGLIESIIESKGDSKSISGDLQGGIPVFKSKLGSDFVLENKVSENKSMHDFIYNKVESILINDSQLTKIPQDIPSNNDDIRRMLKSTSCVLIKGEVIIYDYKSIETINKNFIDIYHDLYRMQEWSKFKKSSKDAGKVITSQEKKQFLNKVDKDFNDNLPTDDITLKGINTYLQNFPKERLQIKAFPYRDNREIRFTALLNNAYLRDDIPYILYKYGTAPESEWNIFAQIASIPPKDKEYFKIQTGNQIEISMHDLFNSLRNVELVTTQSVNYPEISITPIAIYRE